MTPLRTLSVLLLSTAAALPAQDDRIQTVATAQDFLTGQTVADLNALANAGWRVTTLEIESTSPWSFTVAVVANVGAYFKDWSFVVGQTKVQLDATFAQTGMRPIEVEPYVDNGTLRFVALMIANAGADAMPWLWDHDMSPSGVYGIHYGYRARVKNPYVWNGQDLVAVVFVDNSGANQLSWGSFTAWPVSYLEQQLGNGYCFHDMFRRGADSYDGVLLYNTTPLPQHYFDLTASQVRSLMTQDLYRPIDIERRSVFPFGTRYDVIAVDNANAIEQVARQRFLDAPAGSVGEHGFFLQQIGGNVLAEMRGDAAFEPASVMGTVYHAHAMRRVMTGPETLATQMPKPVSCGVNGGNQGLGALLQQMMAGGDDLAALAVSNHFGLTDIEATADALGMTGTDILYTIGCGPPVPESTMTLRDLSRLHEQVAAGYLGAQRSSFYGAMEQGLAFPAGSTDTLASRIDQEALTYGVPDYVRDAFKAALHIAHKQGGTSWFQGSQHYYEAGGGFLSVPWKLASGQIVDIEYTFGAYDHDFATQQPAGRMAVQMAQLEMIWHVVRLGLATWGNYTAGSTSALPGTGCIGSAGTPQHGVVGTPELGETLLYRLTFVPANAIYVGVFGFSSTAYQGIPLPLDLGVIGAPGCMLRTSVDVQMVGIANGHGTGSTSIVVGIDSATIGTTWFSQHLVLDPTANPFGATLTNAWQTTIGGWL